MKNIIFTFLALLLMYGGTAMAQVTIGSDSAPDANALLDLKNKPDGSSDKGILLPRVKLVSTTSPSPMTAHTEGMVVYNTVTAGDVTPGYYYNNGTKWVRTGSDITLPEPGWSLTGNTGISTANFIGTIDNQDIVFKRNNLIAGKIAAWNTSIGANTLASNITGDNLTALGYSTLNKNTTGSNNTAIGFISMFANTIGTSNTAIGHSALNHNSEGNNNTAIGATALGANTTANNSTALGFEALKISAGEKNIAVGSGAFSTLTSATNNIGIGVNVTSTNTNNFMNIANTIYGTGIYNSNARIGIGYNNTAPTNPLHVKGLTSENPVRFENLQTSSATTDKVVVADATGVLKIKDLSDVSVFNAWGLRGNAGTNPATHFIGTTDNKGFKSVNYIEIVPILTKALQEMKKENTSMKSQLDELRELVMQLQTQINERK